LADAEVRPEINEINKKKMRNAETTQNILQKVKR